jgi:hypothetical protein
MSDLVKRLRCYADLNDAVYHPWVYGEAADRIEQLEAALREIEQVGSAVENIALWQAQKIARAALGEKKDGTAQ